MFHKIRIGPDGAFRKYIGGNREKNEKAQWERVDSLLRYMGSDVELTEDCTFGDVWRYIEYDYDSYEIIFSEMLGMHELEPWIEEAKNVIEPDGTYDYLYIGRSVELENYSDTDRAFVPFVNFGGYGKWNDEPHEDGTPNEGGIAVDFAPMGELMKVPLRLRNDVILESWNHEAVDRNKLWTKDGPYKTEFTCYEMIGAILYEISWNGSPNRRDDKLKCLRKTVEEAKENIVKFDGDLRDAGFTELSDVLEELKRKDEEV